MKNPNTPRRTHPFLAALAGLGALAGAAAAAYAFYIRPKIVQRWGASDAEVAGSMPGDELLSHAGLQSTRAITIYTPPAAVWAWLVQIGYGRAGWYSYDELEEAAGVAEFSGGKKSAREILPQFQELKAGDKILTHAEGGFTVDRAEPAQALVLRAKIDPRSGQTADLDEPLAGDLYSATWAFRLTEVDPATTRLVVRFRVDYPPTPFLRIASPVALEPVVFLMEQKMLKGIKERAESALVEVQDS